MDRSPFAPTQVQRDGEGGAGLTTLLVLVWALAVIGAGVAAFSADAWVAQAVSAAALGTGIALAVTLLAQVLRRLSRVSEQIEAQGAALAELRRQMAEPPVAPVSPIAQSKLDAIAAAQEQTDTRLTLFFSRRARAPEKSTGNDGEPLLALGEPLAQSAAPLGPGLLIRALHFPEDADDADGFDALRLALADARTAPLIRAAQDVLTHLAQEGIYMDDLRPDRARPEFWRAFAQGTRGPMIAPLGGIRDRSCLALTAARMRNNPEFKAAAHLFLREFDKVLAAFEPDADDAQIAALSETRSARAFMLLGRVSGVFSR